MVRATRHGNNDVAMVMLLAGQNRHRLRSQIAAAAVAGGQRHAIEQRYAARIVVVGQREPATRFMPGNARNKPHKRVLVEQALVCWVWPHGRCQAYSTVGAPLQVS